MTGGWSNDLIKHCHFRIFDSNNEIFFKDVRKFGNMKIITQSQFNEKFNSNHDLLNKSYNLKIHLNYLETKIKAKKSICSIIMDQKYFPGVGNYIKSESLYASKIHPEEKWGNLTKDLKINLIKNIQRVMNDSYNSGGAELKDFKNPFNTASAAISTSATTIGFVNVTDDGSDVTVETCFAEVGTGPACLATDATSTLSNTILIE